VRLISCHSRASPKPRSERKNSPDHQKARGDGRFAGAKCCSAARSSRPISDITPVYSITSAGVTSNADGTFRPKSRRSCLEGLACRKSVPSWLRGTIVHLQRAGLTMKTILVPTKHPDHAIHARNGGAARAAHRRLYRGRSASVGMSRKCHEQKYFYYFAIRQANSTTVAPSAAATTDVTIPPPSARSTAM
jgi:hypothetical protein